MSRSMPFRAAKQLRDEKNNDIAGAEAAELEHKKTVMNGVTQRTKRVPRVHNNTRRKASKRRRRISQAIVTLQHCKIGEDPGVSR